MTFTNRRSSRSAGRAALTISMFTALAMTACGLFPRAGDPARLPKDDPRIAGCGIPTSEVWMVFAMAEARDFSLHFPGWSEGADELLVPDPALVIISHGYPAARGGGQSVYEICIAVGPPSDALIHHYGLTRFDAVVPNLGGPPVPMP